MAQSIAQPAAIQRLPHLHGFSLGWLGRLLHNRSSLVGLAILIPVLLVAAFSTQLPLADPLKPDSHAVQAAPSLQHLFGTDKLGRDVFSRAMAGLQISLIIGFSAAGLSLAAGIVIGTVAGLAGKLADTVISALVDVFLAFPTLLLAIAVITIFGRGVPQLIGALAIAGTPGSIRLQRVLTMGLRSRTYMDAARLASAPGLWLLRRHVVPNTLAPLMVYGTLHAAAAILTEATLSFLGIGITPPQPSLGNIIADGRPYLQDAWWISTLPGLVVALVSVSLHLVSDGVREELDERSGSVTA